jgi:hypothetical protein
MNQNNPLELCILIFLGCLSVYLFERLVAKAFKTFIFGLILFAALLVYNFHYESSKKSKLSPLEAQDVLHWSVLKQKLIPYEKEAIKDIKIDYKEAKKNFK